MTQPVFLLGIVGGSASGKSRLAEALARHYAPQGAYVIPEDDYYVDAASIPDFDPGTFNFDEPAAKEHDLLAAHLGALKTGRPVEAPLYDFATHRRRPETVVRAPAPVVLVEGLHLLASEAIAGTLDLAVFVDACSLTRFERRLQRDVTERARTPESVKHQFETIVEPMHARHVEPQRDRADLVVENMGEPDFDALARPVIERVSASRRD
jgi:uridine kinase